MKAVTSPLSGGLVAARDLDTMIQKSTDICTDIGTLMMRPALDKQQAASVGLLSTNGLNVDINQLAGRQVDVCGDGLFAIPCAAVI